MHETTHANVFHSWLKETFDSDQFDLINVNTLHQAADVLTKPFTSPQKWDSALYMLNMVFYTYKKPPGKGNSLAVTPSRGDPVQYFDISTPENSDKENELDQGGTHCPISNPNNNKGSWSNGAAHLTPNLDNQGPLPKDAPCLGLPKVRTPRQRNVLSE